MKKIKNPLIRRIPKELIGDWKKYLVVFLFLVLTIGFVSGMYVANESMITSANEGVTKYKQEDGHFELKKQADATLLSAIETGEKADVKQYYLDEAKKKLDKKLPKSNWLAMWIFLGAIAVVALLGADSDLRPSFGGKPLSMVLVIQMFMLLTGALIIILTKTNPASISKNEVFRSGMIAIVAVYGIAWMAETMFGAHMSEIQGVLGEMVKEYPWAYAIVLLLVSKFVNSQAAALAAIVPVALAIGVDPAYIVASAPACYGYYILPTYPSDLAAIQFDRSGTTHIGRFVINHSFILPGLIGVSVSCVFGWIFAAMYGFL